MFQQRLKQDRQKILKEINKGVKMLHCCNFALINPKITMKLNVLIRNLYNFVPNHQITRENDVEFLKEFLKSSTNILVLTGAGISTESGIPDYRSEKVGLYARSNHKPIQHQQFLTSPSIRKRYWARNFVGWPRFSNCKPNSTHFWVRDLELIDKISCVVTQNVDGLHTKAGTEKLIELHGSSYRVFCLNCEKIYSRHDLQQEILKINPFIEDTSNMIRPDGDVDISDETVNKFVMPTCTHCNGLLKPDIVFFGDNVPKRRVETVNNFLKESDSVLVLGSSLFVYSGFRIILQALEEKKEIVIVNIGETRADKLCLNKINARCGDILSKISLKSLLK
ncbi:NAD-dependent protein deacylase Sirt4-like [Onthophagus taurus]|uniref:NAD-dependent protein deacylase Sirt4-like n=1 Tax=Onthophagus taurus TaxID=166361 RepID=UPI0039BE1AEE